MGFTPEAQQILDVQEQFLAKKYEEYKNIQETTVLTRDDILQLFQTDAPEIEGQEKNIVRRGEGDEGIVINTVRGYWAPGVLSDFESMLLQAIKGSETKQD
ncbi:hypothetical protein XF24_00160 [candidate division SR1 bacterium Aalborg_AAW-1]|nr:hypothetical protein XF24_00160 [candidate division SR1 bacterium Aalborg_AAW-1]